MPSSDSSRDALLERLSEEFVERHRRGERPPLSEYADRHPELAAEIRDLFPALVRIEHFKPAAGDLTGAYVPQSGPAEDPTPERLGEYRLLRQVGSGGMGVVYEAEQESLGRHVALKVLPRQALLKATYLERFRREAKAAAKLHHTNIVPVFGVGECDGAHYYAMQFIHGEGLDRVLCDLRRLRAAGGAPTTAAPPFEASMAQSLLTGRFAAPAATPAEEPAASPAPSSPTSADGTHGSSTLSAGGSEAHYYRGLARVAVQVADALAYAHRQGILHRDIKPSNLLLDQQGTVWVTDFGLAKAEGADDLTQTGDIVGTVRFMAPERFDGRSLPQSDVYGLGVTLYELLTLRPAFDDTNKARLVNKVLHEPPALPRKLDPHIPRDLETVVLKCLAKDPAERYATAEALAEDLRRFLADRPIKARRVSDAERLWRWCRRNPTVATLLAAVVLLVTVTAVGGAILSWRLNVEMREGKDKLFESYVSGADAKRMSGRAGQRFGTLKGIREALNLSKEIGLSDKDKLTLRNIAIAALCLPDMEVGLEWSADPDQPLPAALDPELRRRVLAEYALDRLPPPAHMLRGLSWYSPDGRFVAVGLQSYINGKREWTPARVWRIDGSAPARVLDDLEGPHQFATAFHPNSKQVAFGHRDGTVSVWDTETRKELRRLGPLPDAISFLAYHPWLPRLAASNGREVTIWDTETGQRVLRVRPPGGTGALAWHPHGHRLAISTTDEGPAIQLFDADTGQMLNQLLRLPHDGANLIAFDHAGNCLATRGWEDVLRLRDAVTGRELLTLPGSPELLFGSDDRWLGLRHTLSFGFLEGENDFGSHDRWLGLRRAGDKYQALRLASGQELRVLHRPTPQGPQQFGGCALHPDGRLLVATTPTGLGMFDLFTGEEIRFVAGDFRDVRGFDRTGALWTVGSAGLIRWPVQLSADPTHPLRIGPPEWVANFRGSTGCSFSAEGRVAVIPWYTCALVVHRGVSRRVLRLGPQYDVRGTCVSPDGRWVVTGSHWYDGSDVRWKLWEADTGKLVANLPYPDVAGCLGFSPDSRWLYVSGKEDRRLQVASLAAASVQAGNSLTPGLPPGQGQWKSESVKLQGAFSPDNRVRAYGTHQGVVHLVSPETDQEIARLPTPEVGLVLYPAFSSDGSRLLVRGHESGSLYVFDLRRIREQLAELGLDWEDAQSPLPAPIAEEKATPFAPLRVELIDAEWATNHEKMSQYEARRAVARLFVNPFDADAHYRLGGLLAEGGRHAAARAHLTAALAFRPDLESVYPLRAQAALALRRWDEAVADATHYLEKYPYDYNLRQVRATANHGRQHDAEAVEDLTALLSQYPQAIDLWERRADSYEALGQKEKAAADRAEALKLAANNPGRLNDQAWELATGPEKKRDPARALTLIQKAIEREPDNDDFLNTLGVVQYRNGQYAAAILSLEKNLTAGKGRSDGFDLFFLAMCHARLGEPVRAKDCFDRAVKWTETQKELPPHGAEELKTFRAEAEAELRAR
jgi:serine/threonine protein kinase/WD40 repeat protein/tetratricopeptide (TPR) repeat protein